MHRFVRARSSDASRTYTSIGASQTSSDEPFGAEACNQVYGSVAMCRTWNSSLRLTDLLTVKTRNPTKVQQYVAVWSHSGHV